MGEAILTRRGGTGGGGFYPSLFVTGLEETDTCTATCNGKTFNGVWTNKGRLPSEYQEVEYIESSGTQYIDTGFYDTSGCKVDLSAEFTEIGSDYYEIYGSQYPSSTYRTWFGVCESKYFGIGSGGYGKSTTQASTNTRYKMEYDSISSTSTLKVDGTTVLSITKGSQATSNHYLFALHNGNVTPNISDYVKAKLYYCKVYDHTETLIRDFIPCYRKSDNVIGMYDTVNDVFYTNAGSGSFSKGADINTSGFLFSNLAELGTYIVSNGTSTMAILIDAPIEYTLEWSTIPRNGLVAEYLFDGDTMDTSPNGNDLTNHGVTFSNNTGVFSGSSYAQASNGVIPTNSPLSVSFWVKCATPSSAYLIMGTMDGASQKGLRVGLWNNYFIVCLSVANGSSYVGEMLVPASDIGDNLWHHIAITYKSGEGKLYLDGTLKTSTTSVTLPNGNTTNFVVGRSGATTSNNFVGSLDNIRIYNRVLTDVEISTLFNEGG